MGWLWGGSNGSTKDLDPSLQDFLKKEAPTGPKPALPSAPKPKPAESTPPAQSAQSEPEPEPEPKPVVPPESQFPDGRYAHLWKNYTPQHILLDRSKSDQDRLNDLLQHYNHRRSNVGRIAQENCMLEYMEQWECFRRPKTWTAKATLCNAESKRFNRCYDIQKKFLMALGYLTMDQRSQEEDERIQLHADGLYRRMIAHEAEVEKAKEEGREPPKMESYMREGSEASEASKKAAADVWDLLKPEAKERYEKKYADLSPEQREYERMAVAGELRSQTAVAKALVENFEAERAEREKRRLAGQGTIGDTFKYWFRG